MEEPARARKADAHPDFWARIRGNRILFSALVVLAGILLAFPVFYFGVLASVCLESPGFCLSKYSGRIAESEKYWATSAQPFSIIAHRFTGGDLEVAINNTARDGLTMTGFAAGGGGKLGEAYGGMNRTFAAGHGMDLTFMGVGSCANGSSYDLNVTMDYVSADGVAHRETGLQNIMGRCS